MQSNVYNTYWDLVARGRACKLDTLPLVTCWKVPSVNFGYVVNTNDASSSSSTTCTHLVYLHTPKIKYNNMPRRFFVLRGETSTLRHTAAREETAEAERHIIISGTRKTRRTGYLFLFLQIVFWYDVNFAVWCNLLLGNSTRTPPPRRGKWYRDWTFLLCYAKSKEFHSNSFVNYTRRGRRNIASLHRFVLYNAVLQADAYSCSS